MARIAFSFDDLASECEIQENCYQIEGRQLGLRIAVPVELQARYPYNASAYAFLQELRELIYDCGTVEFPDLPVNPVNHTVAIRSPREHAYSSNPFLTDYCQAPHQDTPPYPTAFWLGETRKFFATWLLSNAALAEFLSHQRQNPQTSMQALHRELVADSVSSGNAVMVNRDPGLILIDNSPRHRLYHARSCNFPALDANPEVDSETPLYAFNEIGLLEHIDSIDSRRGPQHRDASDLAEMQAFMAREGSPDIYTRRNGR